MNSPHNGAGAVDLQGHHGHGCAQDRSSGVCHHCACLYFACGTSFALWPGSQQALEGVCHKDLCIVYAAQELGHEICEVVAGRLDVQAEEAMLVAVNLQLQLGGTRSQHPGCEAGWVREVRWLQT